MEGLLASGGLKIKDFKQFVDEQSKRIVQQAEDIARKNDRQFVYSNGR